MFNAETARDRREILNRIVGKFLVQTRIHRYRPDRTEYQRIAIGVRMRADLHTDDAVPARSIVDNDLLSPRFGEFLADDPCRDIRTPAGCDSDDDANGLARIGFLRMCAANYQTD